jgi:hypothetical protein
MPDTKLVRVKVVKPFILNHDNGTKEPFAAGIHEVPSHVADHWYFKAHTDKAPKDKLELGTPQYASAMKALAESRRKALEEAEALLAEAEAAAAARLNGNDDAGIAERSGVTDVEQAAQSGVKITRRATKKD